MTREVSEAYRASVASHPLPDSEQIDAFVEHLCSAHSWYKHLPLFPPGRPFYVFLNPAAGLETHRDREGNVRLVERTEDTPLGERFHYTWMTTEEYRRRFALLDYSAEAGPGFFLLAADGSTTDVTSPRAAEVPQPVLDAGTVYLTGVIHPRAVEPYVYRRWAKWDAAAWPEETGGRRTLKRIREVIQSPASSSAGSPDDHPLRALIAPEQSRLHDSVRSAIRAMLAVVNGHADTP